MIDWTQLARELGASTRGELRATPLAGGDINRAFRLECGAERYFVKLNHAGSEAMFAAERQGLDTIRASATLRVPEVFLVGGDARHAWIAMEYVDLGGRVDPERLATGLAAMHAGVAAQFGFDGDNTIGSNPQPNSWSDDWVDFWRATRLGFQLQLARENGLDRHMVDRGLLLADKLDGFFTRYRPRPSLLHGDLWSGNQGADPLGEPVIFDPACYYGDHEADLAMMELFGAPGQEFFAAYHAHFPIDDDYPVRRDLYNLYHLLNHANLFSGGYPRQSLQVIDRLLAQLG